MFYFCYLAQCYKKLPATERRFKAVEGRPDADRNHKDDSEADEDEQILNFAPFPPIDSFIKIGDGVAGLPEKFGMVVYQRRLDDDIATAAAIRNNQFVQFDGEVAGPSGSSSSSSSRTHLIESQSDVGATGGMEEEARGGHSPGWIRVSTPQYEANPDVMCAVNGRLVPLLRADLTVEPQAGSNVGDYDEDDDDDDDYEEGGLTNAEARRRLLADTDEEEEEGQPPAQQQQQQQDQQDWEYGDERDLSDEDDDATEILDTSDIADSGN